MPNGYKLIDSASVRDIKGECLIYEHEKTGARVVFMQNGDEHRSMNIVFKTPPANSRGTTHIIEHSVFCGSEHYPLKDPFVELMKGSMYTFLNAMTYDEMTAFPVSGINAKDFDNLTDVYLDAVFNPLMRAKEEIFLQEGWHYETDGEGGVTASGVVLNEMKGMAASADFVMGNAVKRALFKDTPYRYVSGGLPEEIVDLSYEELKAYYDGHYHPSNCVIVFYGKLDAEERLSYLAERYLDKYERRETNVNTVMPKQEKLDKRVFAECAYPAPDEGAADKGAFMSYSVVISDSHSAEDAVAMYLLDYALCSSPAAYLREAFMEKGIGEDFGSSFDSHVRQPYYMLQCSYCSEEDLDEFVATIEDTLRQVADNGIDKDMLRAAMKSIEFSYREDDFTGSPKGLVYSDMLLEKLIYGEENPIARICLGQAIDRVKSLIDTDYFENFIKERILDNPHKAVVLMRPDAECLPQSEALIRSKAEKSYKAADKRAVTEALKRLEAYRNGEDDERAREAIPVLEKSDLRADKPDVPTVNTEAAGIPLMMQPRDTNGIGYLNICMDIRALPDRLIPYARIIAELLAVLDTENYTYGELTKLIDLHTGGIYDFIDVTDGSAHRKPVIPMLVQHSSFFYGETDRACALNYEILKKTDFSDKDYILDLLLQLKSVYVSQYSEGSSSVAAGIGKSGFFEASAYYERLQGHEFYLFLDGLIRDFDSRWQELSDCIRETAKLLTAKENCRFMYIGERESFDGIKKRLEELGGRLEACGTEKHAAQTLRRGSVGCIIPSQVQYVALCGRLGDKAAEQRGHILVLEHILNCDYLWSNIRVLGGAYGASADFMYTGAAALTSYRDPGLAGTVGAYRAIPEYVRTLDITDRQLRQYIVGTMSKLDAPLSQEAEGMTRLRLDMSGVSHEELLRIRRQVIDTRLEDIRALAPLLEEFIADADLVVLGGRDMLEKNGVLFDRIENIL
ncbi:MAG: insulinase family protein [Butyrivibrio sp.]|nr:insulinase family protein [Butyrivibrio sp.]